MKRLIIIIASVLVVGSPLYALQRPRAVSAAGAIKVAWVGVDVGVLARVRSLEGKSNTSVLEEAPASRSRATSTGERVVASAALQALFQQKSSALSSASVAPSGAGAAAESKTEAARVSADASRARAFSAGAGAAVKALSQQQLPRSSSASVATGGPGAAAESKKEESKRPTMRPLLFATSTHLACCRMLMSWRPELQDGKPVEGSAERSKVVEKLCPDKGKDVRFNNIRLTQAEEAESVSIAQLEKNPGIIEAILRDNFDTRSHIVISIPNNQLLFPDKRIKQVVNTVLKFFPKKELAGNPIKTRTNIKLESDDRLKSITIAFINAPQGHTISFFDMGLLDARLEKLSGLDFYVLYLMVIADAKKDPQPVGCAFGGIERQEIEKRWTAL